MNIYIRHFVKAFVTVFILSALLTDVYLRLTYKELQHCNPVSSAVRYHDNLPDSPPLKTDRRWI